MRRTGFCSLLALAALPARLVFATVASDLCPATADPCVVSTAKAIAPGSTLDLGSRALDVRAGGSLSVSSGLMTILGGSVRVESGGALLGSSPQATGASIKVMTSGPDLHPDLHRRRPGVRATRTAPTTACAPST